MVSIGLVRSPDLTGYPCHLIKTHLPKRTGAIMAKRLVYIPITLLFIFSVSALVLHYKNIGEVQTTLMREARLPFSYVNGRAFAITPQASEAGVRIGDGIVSINGRLMDSERSLGDALTQMRPQEPVTISMVHRLEDGSVEKFDATVIPIAVERSLNFYAGVG